MNRQREESKKLKSRRLFVGRSTTRKTSSKSKHKRGKSCSPITRKKVCGPSRKSCLYPKIYPREKLVKKALSDDDILDEFGEKKTAKLSTPQLCTWLGLTSRESIQFNRVINKRICGPDPEPSNPKVWTKDQLLSYIKKNKILVSPSRAKNLSRQELCVLVADWSYNKRTKKTTFQLPHTSVNIYPVLEYKGDPSYVFPFIYGLLVKYPDTCFFMDEKINYNGIVYDCETEKIHISPYLIREMKGCKKRFFVVLIRLTEKTDEGIGRHSNLLLYDKKHNEVWHYEGLRKGLYHECNTQILFTYLSNLFRKELNPNISFIEAPSYCPNFNLARQIYIQKQKGFDTEELAEGLCVIMNLWILDNKFSHPNLSLKEVNENAIKALNKYEYGMLNHILNWMNDRLEQRKVLVQQAKKTGMKFKKFIWRLIYTQQSDRYLPGSLPQIS
jgi:hypothetical protein